MWLFCTVAALPRDVFDPRLAAADGRQNIKRSRIARDTELKRGIVVREGEIDGEDEWTKRSQYARRFSFSPLTNLQPVPN